MSAEDETAKMATEGFVTKYVAEYSDEHEIQPYSGTPKKDGVASAGNASTGFACGDHVHPTDTSRLAVETFNTEISNLRNSFFDNVSYDENSKKILFKNGNTVLKELPATQFIKDGMVSSVAVSNEKLVISFNTDAGKEDIQIPLTDIFNPSNYYDKTAADGRFVRKEAGKGLVSVDAALATSGAAADAKAVGDALRSGFTEWEFSGDTQSGVVYTVVIDEDTDPSYVLYVLYANGLELGGLTKSSADELSVVFTFQGNTRSITATRHAFPPTKTSQLTNDGAPNGGGNAYVMTNDTRLSDARTPTAHHATHAANGSDPLSPADIGAASVADLPYALVEPGVWEFSDGQSHAVYGPTEGMSGWFYMLDDEQTGDFSNYFSTESDALAALSLTFVSVTATRPSIPGHLVDRAVNAVSVSGDTTLTLPALVNAGKARDFLVRLEISGSTVPTITFQGQGSEAPNGADEITYETDGDEFPVPDEAGTLLYSFTETAAHTFAVSLKKVQTVTQGGS